MSRRIADPVCLYPLSEDPKIHSAAVESSFAFTLTLPPVDDEKRPLAIEDLRWVFGSFVEGIANAYSSESRRRTQACSMIEQAVVDAGLSPEEIASMGLFREDGKSKHRRYWNPSERPNTPYHQRFY